MTETAYIEDFELAKKCSRGDDNAREELYRKYAAYIFMLCFRYVNDKALAQDLMHDSMIKIFHTIGKYRPTGPLKSWCTRVAVNMVIDHLRKSKRMNLVPLEQSQREVYQPQENEIAKIPKTELLRMVAGLPQTKRIIFNLFCIEGYSHKDIAQMLGIKEKTSSSMLFKAREQLSECIRDYLKKNESL